IVTLAIYIVSMAFLPAYFDLSFILTWVFVWKVAVITAISSIPFIETVNIVTEVRNVSDIS
ncbi:13534_t:CDS:2, partial [Dentiscutata heterogama]